MKRTWTPLSAAPKTSLIKISSGIEDKEISRVVFAFLNNEKPCLEYSALNKWSFCWYSNKDHCISLPPFQERGVSKREIKLAVKEMAISFVSPYRKGCSRLTVDYF